MIHQYKKLTSDIAGLSFIPDLGSDNEADWIGHGYINGILTDMNHKHQNVYPEFSRDNKKVLGDVMEVLYERNNLKNIVEIGVNRSGEWSSTTHLLKLKSLEVKYVGIDIAQHLTDSIHSPENNSYGLCTDSSNYDIVINYLKSLDINSIDLFIIDGYHSIGQVLREWKYTNLLSVGGYVFMHDTNYHPGPYCVFDAIDENFYKKKKFLTDREYDWGVAIAKKIKNYEINRT